MAFDFNQIEITNLDLATQSSVVSEVETEFSPDQPAEPLSQQAQEENSGLDEQPDQAPNQTNPDTPGPENQNLNRIAQIFPPTIQTIPIRIPLPSGRNVQEEYAKDFGNLPIVFYNSYQIELEFISFLQIDMVENVPHIKLVFSDNLNLMKDQGQPLDGTIISVFVNSRSDNLKSIKMDFRIIDFKIMGPFTYVLEGIINVPNLYLKKFKAYSKMTSLDVIKELAKESGLGLNSNISDTNDKMTWINTGKRNLDFLKEVMLSSYISDQTFVYNYLDFFYSFNTIDIEKELDRDVTEELGIRNIGIEKSISSLTDDPRVQGLFLSNDFSLKTSNMYFEEYKILNNVAKVSVSSGYSTKTKYYDHKTKSFLEFDIDAIVKHPDKKITFRGAPEDQKYFEENVNYRYMGKMDTDNVHPNFHYAKILNERNYLELQKMGLEIKMGTPNFNLYRFQKIFVLISNQTSTPSASFFNYRLSGEWLITDILYKFDGRIFSQIIKLSRKNLELSPEEISLESEKERKPIEPTNGGQDDPARQNPVLTPDGINVANLPLPPGADLNTLTPDVYTNITPEMLGTQQVGIPSDVVGFDPSFSGTNEIDPGQLNNFSPGDITSISPI